MNAHKIYKKIQKETLSGRSVEVQVLRKAAVQFRQVLASTDDAAKDKLLDAAVRYNLRIWNVFQTDWERPDCPLGAPLRTDLLRLSLYVHKNSMEVLAYASPDKLRTLINIDECLAEGLVAGSKAPIPTLAPA
jgi:flagellar biosynthesis activator protein FlaF